MRHDSDVLDRAATKEAERIEQTIRAAFLDMEAGARPIIVCRDESKANAIVDRIREIAEEEAIRSGRAEDSVVRLHRADSPWSENAMLAAFMAGAPAIAVADSIPAMIDGAAPPLVRIIGNDVADFAGKGVTAYCEKHAIHPPKVAQRKLLAKLVAENGENGDVIATLSGELALDMSEFAETAPSLRRIIVENDRAIVGRALANAPAGTAAAHANIIDYCSAGVSTGHHALVWFDYLSGPSFTNLVAPMNLIAGGRHLAPGREAIIAITFCHNHFSDKTTFDAIARTLAKNGIAAKNRLADLVEAIRAQLTQAARGEAEIRLIRAEAYVSAGRLRGNDSSEFVSELAFDDGSSESGGRPIKSDDNLFVAFGVKTTEKFRPTKLGIPRKPGRDQVEIGNVVLPAAPSAFDVSAAELRAAKRAVREAIAKRRKEECDEREIAQTTQRSGNVKGERLSRERERELLVAAKDGNRKAMTELMARYDRMIVGLAITAAAKTERRIELDDLIQVARLGFLTAIREFNPASGWRIFSLAQFHIKGGLHMHALDMIGPTRIGTNFQDKKAFVALRHLAFVTKVTNDAKPNRDELVKVAAERNIEIEAMLRMAPRVMTEDFSLDDPNLRSVGKRTLDDERLDNVAPEDNFAEIRRKLVDDEQEERIRDEIERRQKLAALRKLADATLNGRRLAIATGVIFDGISIETMADRLDFTYDDAVKNFRAATTSLRKAWKKAYPQES
jgi:DNA-directed RNA polymerase specialized sigma subunit